MHLRQVIDREQNQSAVWSEIAKENRRDGVHTSTEAYTASASMPTVALCFRSLA